MTWPSKTEGSTSPILGIIKSTDLLVILRLNKVIIYLIESNGKTVYL